LDHSAESLEIDVAVALNQARVARQQCGVLIHAIHNVQPTTENEANYKLQALRIYHAYFNIDNMIFQPSLEDIFLASSDQNY